MIFYDKNGVELHVGDHIIPTQGQELMIVSQGHIEEYENDVMFGQQVKRMECFSILTAEDLAYQWEKVESNE